MAKNTQRNLWICAGIIVVLWIIFAFICPLDKVNAPEIEDEDEVLFCDDWSVCPILWEEDDNNSISWEEAKTKIMNWEIKSIMQLHSLEVTLIADDWTSYTTTEPAIDDVFNIVKDCWETCSNILLWTE